MISGFGTIRKQSTAADVLRLISVTGEQRTFGVELRFEFVKDEPGPICGKDGHQSSKRFFETTHLKQLPGAGAFLQDLRAALAFVTESRALSQQGNMVGV